MSRRLLALPTVVLALGLAACGSDDSDDSGIPSGDDTATATAAVPAATPTGTTAAAGATAAADGDSADCVKAPEPNGTAKDVPCPTPTLATGKANVVVMATTQGTFEITLDAKRAPVTANSFAYLAKKGFYDGTVFHRVVPGFVIQGGDPYATGRGEDGGTGGPGYRVTEAPPADLKYTVGTVAMAKGGDEADGASGSQFYVVSGPQGETLPPQYALVGQVTKGLAAVKRIDALGESDGPPKKAVTLTSAKLETR